MRVPVFLSILTATLPGVWSRSLFLDEICVDAVAELYSDLYFDGAGYDDYWVGMCTNPLRVASFYAASARYCEPGDLEPGFALINSYCEDNGFVPLLPRSDVEANLTDDAIQAMPLVGPDAIETAMTINYTTPVMVSPELFDIGFDTTSTWEYEMRTHTAFGFAMYGFWGIVLLFGIIQNLVRTVRSRTTASAADAEAGPGSVRNKESASSSGMYGAAKRAHWLVNTYLVVPSSMGTYRRRLFWWCTVPTRMESLVVGAYWIVSTVLCCVAYRGFDGNLYWTEIYRQIWRYVSDRTGIIAYANLALLWVFSGRNNIFLWATGWPFSTFNLFHKHIGRVATLQAIIHSVGYGLSYSFDDPTGESWRVELQSPWLYLGLVATVAMTAMVLLSVSIIRVKWYESFLLIHIVMSVVTIVCLFYHTSIMDGEYDPYLWPVVAIWGFDRLLRLVRLAICNSHVYLQKNRSVHSTRATVRYDAQENVLRVDLVVGASRLLRPAPGQHYFLYQPTRWTGWENHPFTLGCWSHDGDESSPSATTTLHFWVRPHDGWTRGLRAACAKSPDGCIHPIILLEGPYGSRDDDHLWRREEVLLIAGGSGIAAVVPYVLEHLRRKPAVGGDGIVKTRTRRVRLVWADRSEAFMHSLAAKELAAAFARSDVSAQFYVTSSVQERASSSSSGGGERKEEGGDAAVAKDILVRQVGPDGDSDGGDNDEQLEYIRGPRPNVTSIISDAAESAREDGMALAVLVCGPAGMADEARAATYGAMKRSHSDIEYMEHAFGW